MRARAPDPSSLAETLSHPLRTVVRMDLETMRPMIFAAPLADAAACRAELVDLSVARGLLDAREVEVVRRLHELADDDTTLFVPEVVASASKSSLLAAERLRERAEAAAAIPELGAALSAGTTTGDRVDVVARAAAGLPAAARARLAAHGAQLAAAAGSQSLTVFRKTVQDVVRRVRTDDGRERLARQRAAARLRWWLDGDGMWCLSGRFDPASGARMEGRLRSAIDRPRAAGVPADAPLDPLDRQQFLAATALVAMLLGHVTSSAGSSAESGPGSSTSSGSGSGSGSTTGAGTGSPSSPPSGGWPGFGSGAQIPDVTVLIDAETFLSGRYHENTACNFDLPVETIRRWACLGTVTPVVVGQDGTRLFLGREQRLANRAQRRALRVLHSTCAMCDTPFDNCQIHHVDWAGRGGGTDIDRLLPVCNTHHHLVHEGGWVLHLAPDRTLTVTLPDGSIQIHGPPRASAA